MRVRPTWATPEPGASQVLVRQVRGPHGLLRRADYEVAYFPDGRDAEPQWVRRGHSSSASIPGRTHPTDLHDLGRLVEEAWAEGDDAWIAWPVHLPAAVRASDLRAFTPAEAEALATWRAVSRQPGADAGPFPVRLAVTKRGENALDGLRHEMTTERSTRCGIDRAVLVVLEQTFAAVSAEACPVCAAGKGDPLGPDGP